MRTTSELAIETWPCPQSRAFAQPQPNCRGSGCPLWRWTTAGPWAAAVKKLGAEIGDDSASKKEAAALVAAAPEKYGCHGFCGLGGAL